MSYNVFFILSLIAGIIMAVLSYATLKSRHESGALSFAATLAAISFYAFLYSLQVSAVSQPAIYLYFRLSYIGISVLPSAFLSFALRYSGSSLINNRLLTVLIYILPATNLILVFWNPDNLYFSNITTEYNGIFTDIQFARGILYQFYMVYIGTAIGLSLLLIARMWLDASSPNKKQIGMVLAGTTVPFILYILFILDIIPSGIDPHPFSFTVTGAFIAAGLYRHQLLTLSPPARSQLFDKMPDPVLVLDRQMRIVDFNMAATDILGICSKHYGNSADLMLQEWYSTPLNIQGKSTISSEVQIRNGSSSRFFAVTAANISGSYKVRQGTIVIFHDITGQKESEFLLKQTEKKLRAIIENAPIGVVYFDNNGIVQICNDNFSHQIGYNREKIIGVNLYTLSDQRITRALEDALNGYASSFETDIYSAIKNTTININVQIEVIRSGNGEIEGGLGLITDTTEIKKSQQRINAQNQQLRQVNAEKDRFMSIIAHDLKGPVSAFTCMTELIACEAENMTTKEMKNTAGVIHDSALAVYSLLENLLEWAFMKRKGIELQIKKISIYTTINQSIEQLKVSALKKNITLENLTALTDFAEADEKMIGTVLRNLISNGIKFTKPGGKVSVSSQRDHNKIVVRVSDNGIGIPADKIPELFSITSTYRTTGTQGEPSSGLGLILCKELVLQNNGEIWADSIPGQGSDFCFTLPAYEISIAHRE
jgi:PAS domain S-box-containing protein